MTCVVYLNEPVGLKTMKDNESPSAVTAENRPELPGLRHDSGTLDAGPPQ